MSKLVTVDGKTVGHLLIFEQDQKLIEVSPMLTAKQVKIQQKNEELKQIKSAINDSILIINKETKDPLQLSLF